MHAEYYMAGDIVASHDRRADRLCEVSDVAAQLEFAI
jgi:hypothetical protein